MPDADRKASERRGYIVRSGGRPLYAGAAGPPKSIRTVEDVRWGWVMQQGEQGIDIAPNLLVDRRVADRIREGVSQLPEVWHKQ